MEKQIKYENLSTGLKTLVICGWITIGFSVFLFLIGFMIGLMS